MMRVKYSGEPVTDQSDGVLLDEYVRCAVDHFEDKVSDEQRKLLEEYVVALRDEIVLRMRKVV
jgi:hypothetical protein